MELQYSNWSSVLSKETELNHHCLYSSTGKIFVIDKIIRFHVTRESIFSLGSSAPDFSTLIQMTELAGVTYLSQVEGPSHRNGKGMWVPLDTPNGALQNCDEEGEVGK